MTRSPISLIHKAGRAWTSLIVGAACTIVGVAAVGAQQADRVEGTVRPYGKTPDTIIPYRSFRKPYNRFYESVTEFRGDVR